MPTASSEPNKCTHLACGGTTAKVNQENCHLTRYQAVQAQEVWFTKTFLMEERIDSITDAVMKLRATYTGWDTITCELDLLNNQPYAQCP